MTKFITLTHNDFGEFGKYMLRFEDGIRTVYNGSYKVNDERLITLLKKDKKLK